MGLFRAIGQRIRDFVTFKTTDEVELERKAIAKDKADYEKRLADAEACGVERTFEMFEFVRAQQIDLANYMRSEVIRLFEYYGLLNHIKYPYPSITNLKVDFPTDKLELSVNWSNYDEMMKLEYMHLFYASLGQDGKWQLAFFSNTKHGVLQHKTLPMSMDQHIHEGAPHWFIDNIKHVRAYHGVSRERSGNLTELNVIPELPPKPEVEPAPVVGVSEPIKETDEVLDEDWQKTLEEVDQALEKLEMTKKFRNKALANAKRGQTVEEIIIQALKQRR